MSDSKAGAPEPQTSRLGRVNVTSGQSRNAGTADVDSGPMLAPGTVVNEYQIESRIGEGGMGEVYLAVHPVIDKKVAIKVMRPSLCADEIALERFVQEARAVNRIGHPGLVDIFAFGRLPDGRSFFIMEWLHGETVARALSTRRLRTSECIDVLLQVCDALEAAHAHNIVHRDLKPENIFMVAMRNKRRVVKLLDFGIAKLLGDEVEGKERTQQGKWLGTPVYMSPEQARAQPIDVRSDIYSLGVTAYEMFLGRLPFSAATTADVIAMHLGATPPAPELAWPEVPPELAALLLKMLSKSAADRPTLGEVVTQLQRLRPGFQSGSGTAPTSSGSGPAPSGTGVAPPALPPRPPRAADPLSSNPLGTPIADAIHPIPSEPALAMVAAPAVPSEAALAPPATEMANTPAARGPRTRRRWLAAVLSVTALLIAAVLGWSLRGGRGAATTAPLPPAGAPPVAIAPVAPLPVPAAAPVEAAPPGALATSLTVRVSVPATIELDGTVVSESSRAETLQIAGSGRHQLAVSAPGYRPYRESVLTAADGAKIERIVKLTRLGGTPQRPSTSGKRGDMLDPFAQ